MKESLTKNEKDYIHYLYKITNNLNGNFYIGVHSLLKSCGLDPLTDGYWGSGTLIRLAINCIGLENFSKEILFVGATRNEIFKKESEIVTVELLLNPKCYNLTTGGRRGGNIPVYAPDQKKIIFIKSKKSNLMEVPLTLDPHYAFCPETKDFSILLEKELFDLEENKNLQDLGPVLTEKMKNYRTKGNSSSIGRVVVVKVDDPNRKVVVMSKDDPRYLSGEYIGVMKGQKLSPEIVARRCGEHNSGYDTRWITNGNETRKIKKTEDIPDGWYPGRTFSKEILNKLMITAKLQNEITHPKKKINILNKLTGKLQSFTLDTIFFRNSDELITPEYLQSLYEPTNSWVKVSEKLNMCAESTCKIRDFYKSIGYEFSSTAIVHRPGRETFAVNAGRKYIHKDGIIKVVDKDKLEKYFQDGWKLGMRD